jgi:transcriptional regulator with XRE-family HTH domain
MKAQTKGETQMKSELWQRLRAARDCADLNQADIAKTCGVSRGAVALWESAMEKNRTVPSIDQVRKVSKATKIPVDWLLNDAADPSDVWKIKGQQPAAVPSPPASIPSSMFEQAVKFEISRRDAVLLANFDVRLSVPGQRESVAPDYLAGDTVVEICTKYSPDKVGRLLMAEKMVGRPLRKVIIVLGQDLNTNFLDVAIEYVPTVVEVAERLITLSR